MVLKKLLSIILISIFLIAFSSNVIYGMDNIVQDAEGFIATRIEGKNSINESKLRETSNYLYNVLFTIAVVVAFAIGLIIAIQFIMGSAEEQAKVKETLIPYVIGVFVVFASFTIWKIVITIGNDVSPTPAAIQTDSSTTSDITESGKPGKQDQWDVIN